MENTWYTTESVGNILGVDAKEVALLCRTNKLWGHKTSGPFGRWMIPNESLSLYLYLTHNSRAQCLTKDIFKSYNERYNFETLQTIFEKDFIVFKHYCFRNRLRIVCFIFRRNFECTLIFPFLHDNPDVLKRLIARYQNAFDNGTNIEPIIRNILMLKFYYENYDYCR